MKKLFVLGGLLLLGACTFTKPVAFVNNIQNNKIGESCEKGFLMFPPLVGSKISIELAKANGNIKNISSVQDTMDMYFIWYEHCIVVYGE